MSKVEKRIDVVSSVPCKDRQEVGLAEEEREADEIDLAVDRTMRESERTAWYTWRLVSLRKRNPSLKLMKWCC